MTTEYKISKTPLMLREESRLGKPLEKIIPETYNRLGSWKATAEELGIKQNTLYIWLPRLGIQRLVTIMTG